MNADECIITYVEDGDVISKIVPKDAVLEQGDVTELKKEVRKLKAKLSLMRSYELRCKRSEETELYLMGLLGKLMQLKNEQVAENDQLRWLETEMIKAQPLLEQK